MFFIKPFLAQPKRSLTVPSFKALAVLFSDLQNSGYVKKHNVFLPLTCMTKLCVPITLLVIVNSETIASKNTPKKIEMTKHAKELIVSKDTEVNAKTKTFAKET